MVSQDREGGEALQVEGALLYGPHNTQALELHGSVTLLGRGEGFRAARNDGQGAVRRRLAQGITKAMVPRCICQQLDRQARIEMSGEQSVRQNVLDSLKLFLVLGEPLKHCVLSEQSPHTPSLVGKVGNEKIELICQAHEGFDAGRIRRLWELANGRHPLLIGGNPLAGDNVASVAAQNKVGDNLRSWMTKQE